MPTALHNQTLIVPDTRKYKMSHEPFKMTNPPDHIEDKPDWEKRKKEIIRNFEISFCESISVITEGNQPLREGLGAYAVKRWLTETISQERQRLLEEVEEIGEMLDQFYYLEVTSNRVRVTDVNDVVKKIKAKLKELK